ncbi:hypothetical protein [Massilia glaciei]|uniref:DUF3131 domain-containing protein n=1 Tax=Massilia glaciei TaxID=1524097 RepID=A0A2U2I682_9BURK|nr:hypothetical protein [Massilia glaciei]PWF55268.1 hypothetical protein C7C56_002740 [Massilia glaciei]
MTRKRKALRSALLAAHLALPLALPLTLSGCAAQAAPATAPAAETPMNTIVQRDLQPQLDYFFTRLAAEKEGLLIDGQKPFASNDKFLPGKIAIGLSYVLLNKAADDPALDTRLRQYRDIADLTVGMDNHSWGIYYYLSALHSLKKAGLLERAVSPATLAKLRTRLDWRTFVSQPDYELINLPTNYFGVAFSVARLRMLLGWEDDSAAAVLLQKTLHHYDAYSGTYGFSDETSGEGRFDRYSILLIAEICERFLETGLPVTPELKQKLRKAATVALILASETGEGFSFGRSLGPYGETAMLEILSVAAKLDVLTPDEKTFAYAYSSRIAARYPGFWYDPAMKSVDMWGKGRRTDAYRGKHRILGENFSLLHQLIFTNRQWNDAGFKDRKVEPGLDKWLAKSQPPFSLTWFAKGEYDRALAVFRDRGHVFSLLMVNGGAGQHDNSPYYPLPFAHGLVAGIPDSGHAHPQLLPKFTLADGSELLGAAYLKDIASRRDGDAWRVRYRQDELDRLGDKAPVKDARIALDTEYIFAPGSITRTDTYTPRGELAVEAVTLEFSSFSGAPVVDGTRIRFGEGGVTGFEVDGLAACEARPTEGSDLHKSPNGALLSHVRCASPPFSFKRPLVVRWVLKYR